MRVDFKTNTLQKRQYLMSLPHDHLVSLLLHASNLHPTLPIFAPDIKQSERPSREESRTGGTTAHRTADMDSPEAEEEDDEDALPYPRAGNGIHLPPESDDLAFLLDDDVVTFSHRWGDRVAEGIDEPYARAGLASFRHVPGLVRVGA